MKKTSVRNPLLLLLTAVIWGVAFVAQSVGTDYVGAFTFNFARCMIGGIVLIPCIFLLDHVRCGKRENGGKMAGGSGEGRNCRTEEDSGRPVYTWRPRCPENRQCDFKDRPESCHHRRRTRRRKPGCGGHAGRQEYRSFRLAKDVLIFI